MRIKIKYKLERILINIRLKIVDVILHFHYDDYCNARLISWAFGYADFPERGTDICRTESEGGNRCYCGKYHDGEIWTEN